MYIYICVCHTDRNTHTQEGLGHHDNAPFSFALSHARTFRLYCDAARQLPCVRVCTCVRACLQKRARETTTKQVAHRCMQGCVHAYCVHAITQPGVSFALRECKKKQKKTCNHTAWRLIRAPSVQSKRRHTDGYTYETDVTHTLHVKRNRRPRGLHIHTYTHTLSHTHTRTHTHTHTHTHECQNASAAQCAPKTRRLRASAWSTLSQDFANTLSHAFPSSSSCPACMTADSGGAGEGEGSARGGGVGTGGGLGRGAAEDSMRVGDCCQLVCECDHLRRRLLLYADPAHRRHKP